MGISKSWLDLSPGLVEATHRAYTESEGTVCPDVNDVFRAFSFFEPQHTRVVILGQDPYHSVNTETGRVIYKASGLSFGYHRDWQGSVDSSLQNILTEVSADEDACFDTSLETWAEQGVLLLNTRLTVEAGKPMSHAGEFPGWNQPIAELIQALNKMHRRDLVWMCWGTEARKATNDVQGIRICTSHPCRYSYRATDTPFQGSNCFNRANEALHMMDREPIEWQTMRQTTRNMAGSSK